MQCQLCQLCQPGGHGLLMKGSGQFWVRDMSTGSESHQLCGEPPCKGRCAPHRPAGSLPWGSLLWGSLGMQMPLPSRDVLPLQPQQSGWLRAAQLQGAGSDPKVRCIQRGIMNKSPFNHCSRPFLGLIAGARAAGTAYARQFNKSWDKRGLKWGE